MLITLWGRWLKSIYKNVSSESEVYMLNECLDCGFNDCDYGCTCPHSDMWYACPIENKKPENIQALKDYAEQTENTLAPLPK